MKQAIVFLALAVAGFGQQNPEWTKPFPPFKILGNIYWVGTYDLSTYLITTPEGNILINSGLAETVPLIKAGVEQLGFKMSDTKILLATHGHFDHVAGMAALKKMTGAKMVMSEQDAELLESGGKVDFRFGDSPEARFTPVTVDRKLKDGDKINGITVLVAEARELTVVNIVGAIDPEKLGELGGHFGIPDQMKDQSKPKLVPRKDGAKGSSANPENKKESGHENEME